MSSIRYIIKDGAVDLSLVAGRLKHYASRLKDWESDLSLHNKNLRDVLIEQNSVAAYYDEMKAEISTLKSYMELLKDKQAGNIYVRFSEDSSYSHNYNAIQQIIKADDDYIMYRRLELEFKELYDRVYGICGQFQQRGYTLTNIVKVMESELQDVTLTKEHG